MARYPKKGSGNQEGFVRPKFTMYNSQKDIEDFMIWVKKNYKKNIKLATWYGDHLFGKAIQPMEGDLGGGKITIAYDNSFNHGKNS